MFEEDTIEITGVVEHPPDYLELGFSQAVILYHESEGIHIKAWLGNHWKYQMIYRILGFSHFTRHIIFC